MRMAPANAKLPNYRSEGDLTDWNPSGTLQVLRDGQLITCAENGVWTLDVRDGDIIYWSPSFL